MTTELGADGLSATQIARLQEWRGRSESCTDVIDPARVAALEATLDRAPALVAGAPLPWLWHWMFFQPVARQSDLGPDGHPRRGGFLPPVPLPRRMFAGGRLFWERSNPLRVGQKAMRAARVLSVEHKHGRSGELVFVGVEYRYSNDAGLALREEQDLVYRAAAQPGVELPAAKKPERAGQAVWSRAIQPDPVLLFRYSALTFNSHRIHYDRPYATGQEGYPGLVVHGPLVATLLLDLLQRERLDAQVVQLSFRALRPTFDGHDFSVHGRPAPGNDKSIALWAEDHGGGLTMSANATLA